MMGKLSQKRDNTLANQLYRNGSQEQADYFGYSRDSVLTQKTYHSITLPEEKPGYHQIDNKGTYDNDNKILVNKQQKSSKHCRSGD